MINRDPASCRTGFVHAEHGVHHHIFNWFLLSTILHTILHCKGGEGGLGIVGTHTCTCPVTQNNQFSEPGRRKYIVQCAIVNPGGGYCHVPIKKGPGKFKNSNLQQQLLATTFCLTENTLSQTGCPKSKRCKTVDVSILYPELLATQTYIKFKDAKISSDSFYPTQLEFVNTGGVFAQRTHSANYYGVYPGNTPENHPPTEACMINSKTV